VRKKRAHRQLEQRWLGFYGQVRIVDVVVVDVVIVCGVRQGVDDDATMCV
jgi:hypothetical protein